MSVKIWEAYRLKPSVARDPVKFWQWVRDMHEQGEKAFTKRVTKVYTDMLDGVDLGSEEYSRALRSNEGDEYMARLEVVAKVCREQYRESAVSDRRSMYDFDVNLVLREYKGNVYIIPYHDMQMRGVLDFLKRDPRLEDFQYNNQVDPPRGMQRGAGLRRWKARGRVWDQVDQNWRKFMVLHICDFPKFWMLDPQSVMRLKHATRKVRSERVALKRPSSALPSSS